MQVKSTHSIFFKLQVPTNENYIKIPISISIVTPAHDAQRGCCSILNAFYHYLIVLLNSSESVTNQPLELRGAGAEERLNRLEADFQHRLMTMEMHGSGGINLQDETRRRTRK